MKSFLGKTVSWLILTIIFTGIFQMGTDFGYVNHQVHEDIQVIKTERIQDGSDSYYLLFLENDMTVKVADQLFYWNFRSSDNYGKITEGQRYDIETHGIRLGFFNIYPILYKANSRALTSPPPPPINN